MQSVGLICAFLSLTAMLDSLCSYIVYSRHICLLRTLIGVYVLFPLIIMQCKVWWLMIIDGSLAASSSVVIASSTAFKAAWVSTLYSVKPNALHNASRSTFPAGSLRRFFPVVGFCWCPVIPVIELSRIITVELLIL